MDAMDDIPDTRTRSAASDAVPVAPDGQDRVKFLDLTDDRCAFIADDPAGVRIEELRCCGRPVGPANSFLGARYCLAHRAVTLVPRFGRSA